MSSSDIDVAFSEFQNQALKHLEMCVPCQQQAHEYHICAVVIFHVLLFYILTTESQIVILLWNP